MKKVAISLLICAIFGGAIMVFGANNNLVNVAEAKGQAEIVENKEKIKSDNSEININKILVENFKFSFGTNLDDDNVPEQYTVFHIKNATVYEFEFELTHQNNKLNEPIIIQGKAKNIIPKHYLDDNKYVGIMEISEMDFIEHVDEYAHNVYQYDYSQNGCELPIKMEIDNNGNGFVHITTTQSCKKLNDTGIDSMYLLVSR